MSNDIHIAEQYDLLDLNTLLITDPPATFFVRVSGNSMIDVGIASGDVLVVDKGILAKDGDIVIAIVDGGFTVKRLYQRNGKQALLPENPDYQPIEFAEGQTVEIWGVVTGCVKRFIRQPRR